MQRFTDFLLLKLWLRALRRSPTITLPIDDRYVIAGPDVLVITTEKEQ